VHLAAPSFRALRSGSDRRIEPGVAAGTLVMAGIPVGLHRLVRHLLGIPAMATAPSYAVDPPTGDGDRDPDRGLCRSCGRLAAAPLVSALVGPGRIVRHWTCGGCGREWSSLEAVPGGSHRLKP
jgi:hypothetical protein